MNSQNPTNSGGVKGGAPKEWRDRLSDRQHLRILESIVYDGWQVPADTFATVPKALLDIAQDSLQSTRDRIRATEALAHLIQHRAELAIQFDRILRLDAGQATDRVQVLDSLTDAQMRAVAQSIVSSPSVPIDTPKPRRSRTSRP